MPGKGTQASRVAAGVSVLVVSNRPWSKLRAALHTVLQQDFRGRIHVVVIGDNPDWRPDEPAKLSRGRVLIEAFGLAGGRAFRDQAPVKRVSRLRNIALTFARERFVCFLDDDNRWEANHLSTLASVLESGEVLAAHSWRQLVDADGAPWCARYFPWACEPKRKTQLFKIFCRAGVMSPGSHIFRDTSQLLVKGKRIGAVDMGAWMFERSVFDSLRFETEYTEWEVENSVTEDDKLLAAMTDAGLPVACSEQATLKYSLGGYSNRVCGRR